MSLTTRQLYKVVSKNISKNKYSYVAGASLLQFLLLGIGMFGINFLFKLALIFSGQENLDKNNILVILLNPLSLITLIIMVLVTSLVVFIEFSILTSLVYSKITTTPFTVKKIVRDSIVKSKNLIGKQLIFFILYFILLIPVANLGMRSIFMENLYVPKFITGEFMKTNMGLIGVAVGAVILFYLNLRLIFTLPLNTINTDKFSNILKRSWRMTSKGKTKLLIVLARFVIKYSIQAILVVLVLYIVVWLVDSTGSNLIVQTIFFTILNSIIFFFSAIIKITTITTLLTLLLEEEDIASKVEINTEKPSEKTKLYFIFTGLIIVGTMLYNSAVLYVNEPNSKSLTIAHRGYVDKAVENSIEGLEEAAKAGADYVELDILLTKDNKFVVMHDYNLKRLAGIDKKVQDMTYDEVVGLPIKQGDFESKIPSFEEFVKKAKELNIKLLVELKPHGAEPDNYVDLLIDKAKELGIDKEYKYMSLDLKVMEEINSKADYMDTGYVIPLQFGKFANNNVDFFVIEDFSYRESLVSQANSSGKSVYVWTINDEATMRKYLQTDINGIITDKPKEIKDMLKDMMEHNTYYDKIVRLVEDK